MLTMNLPSIVSLGLMPKGLEASTMTRNYLALIPLDTPEVQLTL